MFARTKRACYVDRVRTLLVATAVAIALVVSAPAGAQNQGKGKAAKGGKAIPPPANAGPAQAYPQRVPGPPEVVARGKALFEKECGFCHGNDARGGDMASNLIRSQVILNDDDGEKLAPVLRGEGMEGTQMPKFNFTAQQVADIAAYLHSFRVGGYDISRNRPSTIVVGNAAEGQTFFQARCGSCHSATGDLRGIATRIQDPRTLQQRWIMPAGGRGGGGTPVTVTVTPPNAAAVNGRLVRIDDFTVTVGLADNTQRTFKRDGDVPRVEIHDPVQAHRELLRVYSDKNIHDVTAYLVTLK